MKQRILICVVVACVSGLLLGSGCGSSDSRSDSSPSASNEGKSHLSLTLIPGMTGVAFYETMARGIEDYASQHNASLNVVGAPAWGVNNQVPIVQQVTAARPDGVVLVPNDPKGLDDATKEMIAAGIKVVSADQYFADASIPVSQVKSDDEAGGAMAADAMVAAIGKEGQILILSNAADQVGSAARAKGFAERVAQEYPEIETLPIQYDNNSSQTAASIISATLAKNPELKGIFAVAEIQVHGAIAGLRTANVVGRVKLIGYDASPAEVDALKAGEVHALVSQDPYGEGYAAAEQLINSLRGVPVESRITTPLKLITSDNVDDPDMQRYLYTD